MKRVIMFGGCGHRPVEDLNAWLAEHSGFELLDIQAVKDGLANILLFCTVEVPEDVRGLETRYLEYFGLKESEAK